MRVGIVPGAAGLVAAAAIALGGAGGGPFPRVAMFAGGGSAAVAIAGAAAWHAVGPKRAAGGSPVTFARALPDWREGRRAALEGLVAEFVGRAATEHAVRCAALAAMVAEQLGFRPEETADATLAAVLHVLPAAFPEHEDGEGAGCDFSGGAIATARALLERSAPADVAQGAAEVRERWDGKGRPASLSREAISALGRVTATVCAFDHASAAGLAAGLDAIRAGSGEAFDPVVAAELIHLFREPWQLQVAA
ncbi:MAG: hypothetical protein IPN07_16905 [Dehalococcoidia bacterium]|nr:hypothetical protein [Dehalococcoidia bacterium]